MDFERIERLMRMLEASSLNALDVTEGGIRIRLAKQAEGQPGAIIAAEEPMPKPAVLRQTPFAILKAGMAGTFYRAPAPGAEPFVVVGSTIEDGNKIAIIEAMKMLNPVEADCSGVVRAILVEDGGSVEPGTALFEIETR